MDYSINLSRIEWANPNVTFKRDENQEQYFEWNEMVNATSYIVRAYGDDLLINEIEIVKGKLGQTLFQKENAQGVEEDTQRQEEQENKIKE